MKLRLVLIIQALFILATFVLGAVQMTNPSVGLLMLHRLAGVGMGGIALVSLYYAVKSRASTATRYLCVGLVLLAIVGGIGGKAGETSFDLGVLMMRIAAFASMALVIAALLTTRRKSAPQS